MPSPCVIITGHEGDILYRHKFCLAEPGGAPSEEEFFAEAMQLALHEGVLNEEKLAEYILLLD